MFNLGIPGFILYRMCDHRQLRQQLDIVTLVVSSTHLGLGRYQTIHPLMQFATILSYYLDGF